MVSHAPPCTELKGAGPLLSAPPGLPHHTEERGHEVLALDVLEHGRHMLFAVLFLAGKVAECLLPQGGLLLPVPLAHGHHLPVLLVLHVVVHHLLVPGPGSAHLSGTSGKLLGCCPVPEIPSAYSLPCSYRYRTPSWKSCIWQSTRALSKTSQKRPLFSREMASACSFSLT